jgi:hypothetical protein
MQVENDYDKEVYNGDIGFVEDVDADAGELTVRFDGRSVTYGFGELDLLVPAPTEGIGVLTKTDAVILMFRSRNWRGEYGPTRTQRFAIVWTPCTLGGRRPWFRCEVSNGRHCGRRVAILYGAGERFACRHCYRLAYTSQNETPFLRAIRRTRKIRMRRRTYLRMRVAAGESIAPHDQL